MQVTTRKPKRKTNLQEARHGRHLWREETSQDEKLYIYTYVNIQLLTFYTHLFTNLKTKYPTISKKRLFSGEKTLPPFRLTKKIQTFPHFA